MQTVSQRRYPAGAEVRARGIHFRVWAPSAQHVFLHIESREQLALEPEGDGYFSLQVDDVGPGALYRYNLDQRGPFADPASRFQPDGPHGPSEVIDASAFEWTDAEWRGVQPTGQVIYELHIGTLTREGTWAAAMDELPQLSELGITMLEVMPVAEFPGEFGWGYDGVNLYAPYHLYGRPDDFRRFVDRAHALGLAVILDVVYNHLGPDGNYLPEYSGDYFTKKYENDWGDAINFDGENCGPVREFFAANASYWIDEYHLDGLRLDATQQIFDASERNILQEVEAAVRSAAPTRSTYIVTENERQDPKLVRDFELDSIWNDDFHHSAIVALTGKREAYYSDHRGAPQEFVSAAKYGFLFQGQRYAWQDAPRGTPAFGLLPHNFVHFIENHDQVANSAHGARMHQLASAGNVRAFTGLLLLGPQTPMLFQGQEFASSAPFLFFADHQPELAAAVAKGRTDFLMQFESIVSARASLAMPHDPATFVRCKLDDSERIRNRGAWALHRDLIDLRKHDAVLSRIDDMLVDGAVIGANTFVLRYSGEEAARLLVVNLGSDIEEGSLPEPLLAPPLGAEWRLLWSSEHVRYGGSGAIRIETEDGWRIPGQSAALLGAGT